MMNRDPTFGRITDLPAEIGPYRGTDYSDGGVKPGLAAARNQADRSAELAELVRPTEV
jgi:hypothetical protein